MTLKGGTSQACAACKYQRRKCSSECPLAPYFPPDQPKVFENAHRLFGVKNIVKIIEKLDPTQKMEAMKSIIYQSNMRSKFPVHGCCGIIAQYQYQIRLAEEELHAVLSQLALYQQHHHDAPCTPNNYDSKSQLQLGMAPPTHNNNNNNNALSLFHQDSPQAFDNNNNVVVAAAPVSSYQSYPNNNNNNNGGGYNNSNNSCGGYNLDKDNNNMVSSFWSQNSNNSSSNNSVGMQSQLAALQQLSIQPEPAQEYEDMHPFFDTIDDRQSYIDSKEAYDSSSDSSLKDTTQAMEHIADNELKSAAACFSLTSVN